MTLYLIAGACVCMCMYVFVCSSLRTIDVDNLFISLLAICRSSLRNFYSIHLPIFNRAFVFLLLSSRVLCIFWVQVPYLIPNLQIFSSILYLFTFLMAFFETQKFKFLCVPTYFFFCHLCFRYYI